MASKDIGKSISISILFDLPPDKAVDYLKDNGYIITKNWYDLWVQSSEQAFKIAGVLKQDILTDVRWILKRNMEQGNTFETFKKDINNIMQAKGWYINNSRLKLIYSQNTDIAYSVGRYNEQMAVLDYEPYWMYSAIMDMKTRPEHAALHGKVFKATDPFWNYFYPPNGFNCRCRVISITEKELVNKSLQLESTNKGKLIKKVKIKTGRDTNRKTITTHSYQGNKVDAGWDTNLGKEYLQNK